MAFLKALTQGRVGRNGTKQWVHTPELLLKGHVTYNVKFLGECGVDQPKGTEVVKDAIRKMKFNKHLKRAEGQKPPKIQLIISVDGLGIQDPKTKATLHEYPLHRISYCADDKSDKKMFTFIAKAATTNDHYCYVFNCSDKSAEEITLTVGQAFDLAYKRFLEEGNTAAAGANGEVDYKKQCLLLQRKVNTLQFENDALKKRVCELEKLKDRSDLEEFMKNNQPVQQAPQQHSMVGRRLENLIFDDSTQVNGKSGSTAQSSSTPILSPPPPITRHHRQVVSSVSSPVQSSPLTAAQPALRPPASSGDMFNPFSSPGPAGGVASSDPFGMGAFNPASQETPSSPALHTAANGSTDFGASSHQELMDIQAGFSRGLSFGTDDFNLDDLDPLSHRL